jgi:hypothetical protein
MNLHQRIIGIFWLLIGLGIAVISMYAVTKAPQVSVQLLISVTAISSIYIIAGYSLLAGFRWSAKLCLPFAVLTLFGFPIGTVFGAYYLWYFYKFERYAQRP